MKKLRLTTSEKELLIKDIQHTFEEVCKGNIDSFEYTKKDVKDFLNTLGETTVQTPTILINSDVYTKMYELVRQSDIELQWHMMVKRFPETGEYHVYDILLFPQTNSGTLTTTDQNEFAEWQMNLIQDMSFPIEHLRGHGHSHVNMSVYSSGIDDAYQRDLITKVEDGDFYLFFVLNKKMEMYALLYDFNQQIIFETKDMNIEIIDNDGIDIRTWCTEQIKANCKSAPPKFRKTYGYPQQTTFALDSYEDEFIINMSTSPRKFGRRK